MLLRGVNVGKHHRIAMPAFRALLEGVGGTDVRTYVQSGNAVLDRIGSAAALEREVRAALVAEHGLDVPVMVRTGRELVDVVAACPWQGEGLDPKLLHVAFLSGEPDAVALAAVDHDALLPERLAVGPRCLYLYYAGGVQRSRLDRVRLGVDATARNWRTTLALREMAA